MQKSKVEILNHYSGGSIAKMPHGATIQTLEEKLAHRNFKKKKDERKADERGEFVILNLKYLQEKLSDVTYSDLGYALLLLPYVSFFDKDKKKKGNFTRIGKEGEPFTYDKLEEIWGLQPDTVRKLVKKLVDKRILIVKIDEFDKRKKLVHFTKRLVVKGEKFKNYELYTKVYQTQIEVALDLIRNKNDAAKAMAVFAALLIKMNGHSQLLLEDEAKADLPYKDEKMESFFNRIRVANKNATTIISIKMLMGITDNRSIKKSLSLLQRLGMLNQVLINKKKAYMINPTCASKQDSSKFELYGFTLKYFFATAEVSQKLFYKTLTTEEVDMVIKNQNF